LDDTPADALLVMAEFPKRPWNLNQWQKLLGAMATGFASDKQPMLEEQGKDPATQPVA
jgi:hypothetical protein